MQKQLLPIAYNSGLITAINAGDLPTGSPALDGVTLSRNTLKRAPGITPFTDTGYVALGEPAFALVSYYGDDGSFLYLLAAGVDDLFKLDAGVWSSLGTIDTAADTPVFIVKWLLNAYVISRQAPPIKWNGTTLTTPSAYTGVYAACGCVFYSALLLGDVTESSIRSATRLQWTEIGDPDTLYGATNGFQDLLDTPGPIVNITALYDKAIVFKNDSLWEVTYVGSPDYFKAYPLVFNIGCSAAKSVVVRERSCIFLGTDDVYELSLSSSGVSFSPIGVGIQNLLFGPEAIVNVPKLYLSQAIYLEELDEYWLACPSSDSDVLDMLFSYQYLTKTWWLKTTSGIYCFGRGTQGGSLRWSDFTEPWYSSSIIWGSAQLRAGFVDIIASLATDVCKLDFTNTSDDGVWSTAYWESKDFTQAWASRYLSFSVEAVGVAGVSLSYSTDEGYSWENLELIAGGSLSYERCRWDLDVTTETIRFKLTWGEGDTRIRRMVASYVPRQGDRS